MIHFALAKVGIDADRFWSMTWAEYRYACDHYWHLKELAYEQSRFTAFWAGTRLLDDQIAHPSDFIELSIDEESVDVEVVEADNAETLKRMQAFDRKMKAAQQKKSTGPATPQVTGQPLFPPG